MCHADARRSYSLSLSLCRGYDAYRHNVFGDTITVERKISATGTSGYALKDAAGRCMEGMCLNSCCSLLQSAPLDTSGHVLKDAVGSWVPLACTPCTTKLLHNRACGAQAPSGSAGAHLCCPPGPSFGVPGSTAASATSWT